jgi:hypothetical protein
MAEIVVEVLDEGNVPESNAGMDEETKKGGGKKTLSAPLLILLFLRETIVLQV